MSQRGFTLIELVTSLVLIGILTAVAVPNLLDNDNTFAERGYADEIAATLRYARVVAESTECEVRVVVNSADYSTTQHSTLATCDNQAAAWGTTVRRGDGAAAAGIAPDGVTATGSVTIIYATDGKVRSATGPIQIGRFTITVDPISGRVMVDT